MEGEVAIVAFDALESDNAPSETTRDLDDEEVNPFDVLAEWGKDKS